MAVLLTISSEDNPAAPSIRQVPYRIVIHRDQPAAIAAPPRPNSPPLRAIHHAPRNTTASAAAAFTGECRYC
jgi:hypothetical protein